jgi:hypothetical protein
LLSMRRSGRRLSWSRNLENLKSRTGVIKITAYQPPSEQSKCLPCVANTTFSTYRLTTNIVFSSLSSLRRCYPCLKPSAPRKQTSRPRASRKAVQCSLQGCESCTSCCRISQ